MFAILGKFAENVHILVNDAWGNQLKLLNTAKMRGLIQLFMSLEMYGSNKFFDGKKLEIIHIIGKMIQKCTIISKVK